MLINKDHLGFGYRSWRYAMVIDDGVIEKWFEEPGINDGGSDEKPRRNARGAPAVSRGVGVGVGCSRVAPHALISAATMKLALGMSVATTVAPTSFLRRSTTAVARGSPAWGILSAGISGGS